VASVHLKPGSKYWFGFYTDGTGKPRNRSTKLTDEKKALQVAKAWEEAASGKRSSTYVRSVFAEIYREVYKEDLPVATLRGFGNIWLEQLKPEVAAATFAAYKSTFEAICEFLGPRADRDMLDIGRSDLVGFRNELAKKLSPDTTNRYVKILRMLFKVAQRDEFIVQNPAEHVEIIKNRDTGHGRRPFTIPEIQSVLAIADPEWRSLIKFGLYTGQRLADLAVLTWANLDLVRDEIRLVSRKTGKRLSIPIAGPLKQHISTLPGNDKPDDPVHPRAYSVVTEQGRTVTLSNQFTDLLAQVGLREKRTHEGRGIGRDSRRAESLLSYHCLRHTAVSLLKDAGIPQAVVQELIGHDSEAVNRKYTHVGDESLRKAAASLPEI
jgi:integrase